MFKNYLKTAFRHLWTNKTYSFINIMGLAVGLAGFILLMLHVSYEKSYDMFHSKADRIFRVAVSADIADMDWQMVHTPAVLAPLLEAEFPEITHTTRIRKLEERVVQYGKHSFQEAAVLAGEPGFFDVFDFTLVQGDTEQALQHPHTVVISERAAKKYFGGEESLNKYVRIGGTDYRVTGVVKDIPANSHFDFDFLLSLSSRKNYNDKEWFNNRYATYLVLKE